MDTNGDIARQLRDIQQMQQSEAEVATRRWRTLFVLLTCGIVLASPVIVSYIWQILVNVF